ncbi:MAG: hypothetical protein Alis3KO_00590 [Aliiglaciecola sp.]|uniref:hypothetical protein n=1 Tax=Aliiglaciecola sp. M165 TaxID=2593649 RepID=UPI001180DE15|nr:hypothetical protein [Aliiglaciecola sp. M165]TRY32392.1 hypothetical protein FM019_05990 [Aliiglaciecola sp. M165]
MKILILILALLWLTGCADAVTFEQAATIKPVGFWYGLWHGFIFPVAWILSLFMDEVAVYAIYNSGGWYDSGFFLGLGGLSGVGFLHKDSD